MKKYELAVAAAICFALVSAACFVNGNDAAIGFALASAGCFALAGMLP